MNYKIAFYLFNHTSIGGVERVTSTLISSFINNGINVHSIISLRDEKEKNRIISFDKSIQIKQLEWNNLTLEIANYININKITHLIFQGDNMTYSNRIIQGLKQTSCKGYLHYHGSPYAYLRKQLYFNDFKKNPINLLKLLFAKIKSPFKKRKLLKVINSSDYFITVSHGARLELYNLFNIKPKKITTIHNPISFDLTNENSITQKENIIVFISRLERKDKNAFLSIKVWELLYEKHPNWKFKILGNGRLKPEIEDYIKRKQIRNCTLLGHVNNVDFYLKKSKISILTSDSEGFGMGIFESILYKNAIVSTNAYGGITDLVEDNFNGFLVPKNDYKELAKKINILISDASILSKMQESSYKKYQEFQKEDIFLNWKNLLQI